jgi:hypothetical protein
MKVEILYPFIDFRRFSSSKTDLLVQKPQWPKSAKRKPDYYRSMGQVYPPYYYNQYDKNRNYTSSCIANGIRLKDASIKGLKGLNRVIDLKHGNDMFGFYSISFFIKVGTFSNKTIDDVYEDFKKNVKFNIVDIVDHHQCIEMENLKGYLCKQYYWATRRLADRVNKEIKLYQRDSNILINGKGKIVIPTQKEEMHDIVFLEPYFFLEYTNDDELKDNFKKNLFFFMKKNRLSIERKEKMRLVGIGHPFYEKKEMDLKIFSSYSNAIKYNFLLFDYLGRLSSYRPTKSDDQVNKYLNDIAKTYYEAYKKHKFVEMKKIYEKYFPGFTNLIISNLTSSFGVNDLSDALTKIWGFKVTPN